MSAAAPSTRERIVSSATDLLGMRGVDAVSLDHIAADVGVRKQTLLYWFPSRDELLEAVMAHVAGELAAVVHAASRAAPDDPLARVDAVVRAVFRAGVRRPALMGLVRDLNRMPPAVAERLTGQLAPLATAAAAWMRAEMAAGRLRAGDPRLVLAIASSTVAGIASETRALDTVGWRPNIADLRRLRSELRAFLRAALAPPGRSLGQPR